MLIPLTRGLVTEVDDEDGAILIQYNWQALVGWKGKTHYAKRDFAKKVILLHRSLFPDITPAERVDHKDGDGLNNKRDNLRVISVSLNNLNRVDQACNNTSGVRGVSWNAQRNKWSAEIWFKGKKYYLGLFTTLEDAAAARTMKEKEIWRTN